MKGKATMGFTELVKGPYLPHRNIIASLFSVHVDMLSLI